MNIALALHGGAGSYHGKEQSENIAFLEDLALKGQKSLLSGARALDVVTDCAAALEDSGLFVAGRGTGPNSLGEYELDAAVMDGVTRRAGGVCALKGFRHPVKVARRVLEDTPHLLLAGAGAEYFARQKACETVEDPKAYYLVQGITATPEQLDTGTIGAVALDVNGHLAAATSTGGLLGKMAGRVGDSPLIGAGCWADERMAVSCTGQGEYFIKAAVAADISARMKYLGEDIETAAKSAIADMGRLGGYGGVIAIDANGHVTTPYNSEGIRHAFVQGDGLVKAGAF